MYSTRIEISYSKLAKNIEVILKNIPKGVKYFCVVKDNAFGHGMEVVAKESVRQGASYLMVANLKEALELERTKIKSPIFILYERFDEEIDICLQNGFTMQVQSLEKAKKISQIAIKNKKTAKIHLKVDTGLGRYGVNWEKSAELFFQIKKIPQLDLEGIMTHFAQSDELDKSYAHLQAKRFQQVLKKLEQKNALPRYVHCCNTGGFLDLPEYYFNAVRVGILNTGIYPSKVCQRLKGIEPIMEVKTKIAQITTLKVGEKLGYGMHYQAPCDKPIAILPIGYGDGFPRLRNQGKVLICGKFCDILGGVSMDSIMVDIEAIANAKIGDEVVIVGKQKSKEISIHDLSCWKQSVSYDQLTSWSNRIHRIIKK